MRSLILICAASTLAVSLGACASSGGGYAYDSPRTSCERARSNNRAAATVAGAAIGALAGTAVARDDTAGAVVGGVVGGVVGNQAGRGGPCYDRYGNPY